MENSSIKETNDQSLEDAMVDLDEIVKKLEEGNETLDNTLKLYEDGVRLYRYCNSKIEKAEQKITIIQNNMEVPFTSDLREDD